MANKTAPQFYNLQSCTMTIEFHTPQGHVKEWIVTFLMRRLMQLHQKDPDISRMQVYLRDMDNGEKSCAIDLTIYGDSLLFHYRASSFEEACLYVLHQLEEKLLVLLRKPHQVESDRITTVNV